MLQRPTPITLLFACLLLSCSLNGISQTVTFSVARAELYDDPNGTRKVRVLLDSSLKGYLDKYRPGGTKCGDKDEEQNPAGVSNPLTPSVPHPCEGYWKVRKLLKATLKSENGQSSQFYLLDIDSGSRFRLDNAFQVQNVLCEEPLPEDRPGYGDPNRKTANPNGVLCSVDDPATGAPSRAADATYRTVLNDTHLTLDFTVLDSLVLPKTLMLIANVKGLADGKSKPNPHMSKLELSPAFEAVPKEIPKFSEKQKELRDLRELLIDSSKAKDANVGASFSLTGSRGNRVYSHDIAIQIGRLHRLGLRGAYDIIPFYLQHKFARDDKSPKDELKFGAKVNHLLLFDPYSSKSGRPERDLFNSLTTTVGGYVESDFFFSDRVNAVASWKTGLPLNLFDERSSVARITPAIGYEVGVRLKDENIGPKSRFISRALLGVDFFVAPWRRDKTNPFEIEINYLRHVLVKREPTYFVNTEGKEVFGGYSNGPKDFVKARLTFNYNDKFAPYFQYTYGKTPPKYTLQNSVMEAGLKVYLKWEK